MTDTTPAPLTDAALAEMEADLEFVLHYALAGDEIQFVSHQAADAADRIMDRHAPALIAEVRRLRTDILDMQDPMIDDATLMEIRRVANSHPPMREEGAKARFLMDWAPHLLAHVAECNRRMRRQRKTIEANDIELAALRRAAEESVPKQVAMRALELQREEDGNWSRQFTTMSPVFLLRALAEHAAKSTSALPHCLGCTPEAVRRGDPGETHQSGTVEHP